jgi:protein-S-isoprenylcysteine O-methyltransferase Ste14
MLFTALRTALYVTGFLFLFAWIALSVRRFDPAFEVSLPEGIVAEAAGIALMIVGGSLVFTCIGLFVVRGKGTPALFDAPREFVATGPYRYVRNPMYIGGLFLLVGFALYKHSLSIVLFAALLVPLANLLVIFHEEPRLRKLFARSYEEYCRSVNRWIPRMTTRRAHAPPQAGRSQDRGPIAH